METFVPWKKKMDKYDDETDGDVTEIREPKLVDALQPCEFIMRDETNAEAMKKLGMLKWWRRK